jgi:DNA-binding transcriptional regulator YiaG
MTGHEVAAIRAKLGETRDGLAQLVGKEPTAVRDWELGRRRPDGSAEVLLRLLDAEPAVAARLRLAMARATGEG